MLPFTHHCHSSVNFNPFCNAGILNVDFNWFLTCLDVKGFKHFILLFYYYKLWEKEKNIRFCMMAYNDHCSTTQGPRVCVCVWGGEWGGGVLPYWDSIGSS